MDDYNDIDYDGILIKIPFPIYRQNKKKLLPILNKLSKTMDDDSFFSGLHPHIRNSIHEIENVEGKNEHNEFIKEQEEERRKRIEEHENKLKNKEIIKGRWVKMRPVWNGVFDGLLHLPSGRSIGREVDGERIASSRGNIKSKFKKLILDEFEKNTNSFIEKNFVTYPEFAANIARNPTLTFGDWSVGLVRECLYIEMIELGRNNTYYKKLQAVLVREGKPVFPFDVTKYDREGDVWILKDTEK